MPDRFQLCKHPDCLTDRPTPCQLPVDHTYCCFCGAPATEKNFLCPNHAIITALRKNGGSMDKNELLAVVSRCDKCRDKILFDEMACLSRPDCRCITNFGGKPGSADDCSPSCPRIKE